MGSGSTRRRRRGPIQSRSHPCFHGERLSPFCCRIFPYQRKNSGSADAKSLTRMNASPMPATPARESSFIENPCTSQDAQLLARTRPTPDSQSEMTFSRQIRLRAGRHRQPRRKPPYIASLQSRQRHDHDESNTRPRQRRKSGDDQDRPLPTCCRRRSLSMRGRWIGVVLRPRPTIGVMFPASRWFRFAGKLGAIRVPTTFVIVRDEVRHAQPRQDQGGIVPGSG